MIAQQIRIWWAAVISMILALSVYAQSVWPDKSPHQSRFIIVNGVKLHYLDWSGKGDALLFLHGMGDSAHVYDELAPKFTNDFRVLALTRRGHGQSEIPETGYDTATLVEDIQQFLDALRIERVVLAGHSFAGDELTRFAVVNPDRVIKLIYFDSAYDHSKVPESLRFKPLHGGGLENLPTKEESQSLDGARRWVSRIFGEKRGRTIYSMMERSYSTRAEYGEIKAPALAFFVVGYQKDVDRAETLPEPQRQTVQEFLKAQRKYHDQEIERFRREVPNGRVIVFTNADHNCFIDREDEVVREMQAFLAPTAGPQPSAVNGDARADWVDQSPHRTGFLTVNKVRLHYLDWGGKGDTLLFLAGIGDTPHEFDDFAPKFTNQFRVLGLTRRGHGESEVPDSGYDTATRVEDIRQFLDALNISRAVLVGFSAAGGEVTMFAGKHPDRTIKAVYIDAIFDVDGLAAMRARVPRELRRPQDDALDSKRSRTLELMAETEAHTDYKKVKSPVLAFVVVGCGYPTNVIEGFKSLPEEERKVVEDYLHENSAVKMRASERFRTELPSAQVVMFTNANHACFIDRQDEVLREMRKFLSN